MNNKNLIYIFLSLYFFISCGSKDNQVATSTYDPQITADQTTMSANSNHPEILKAGGGEWKNRWSETIVEAIDLYGPNLLNQEISDNDLSAINCLGFNKANHEQKKQLWKVIFASIARYESNYRSERMKPRNYRDVIRSAQNKVPMGILQLGTGATAHGKGCSGAKSAKWLLDPINNLKCGVQIMNNQLSGGRSGRFTGVVGRLFPDEPRNEGSLTRHYYWSVLTYGDVCIPTRNGCRSGKKNRVQERIIEQLNLSKNYEMFNFCFE